jgi:CRP-like cAMP-binding protein
MTKAQVRADGVAPLAEGDKVRSSPRSGSIRPMAVSSPDLKAFLVATPFFGGLSDASLDLLVSMLAERRFDVGATVMAEGEPGRSMFIVRSGELVVSKLGDSGGVIRMAGLAPGDFFGEMTLIEMQNRSATVVAETPTVLLELTARNLYAYYKADIHAYVMVLQNVNRELCRRLRRADNRIAELTDASREWTTPIHICHTG